MAGQTAEGSRRALLWLDAHQHDEDGDELFVVISALNFVRRALLVGLAEERDARRDDARLKGVKEARVWRVQAGVTCVTAVRSDVGSSGKAHR